VFFVEDGHLKILMKLEMNGEEMRMKELQGKVCFVTGGSRGIGRAIVQAMNNAGADVAFTYQNSKEQAGELARGLHVNGTRCRAYQANVACADEMQKAIKQASADLGPISLVVNSAGISR